VGNCQPNSEAPAAAPLFDTTRLAELRESFGENDFRNALACIPGEGAKCLDEIKAAVAARDLNAARRAAHSLKGMAGNFGAARLAAISRGIELELPAIELVAEKVGELEQTLDDTRTRICEMSE
jgi:HPt (histidine-containing phosphotransfer) domain-containing protein